MSGFFEEFTVLEGEIAIGKKAKLQVADSVFTTRGLVVSRMQSFSGISRIAFFVGEVEKGKDRIKGRRISGYMSDDGTIRYVCPVSRITDLWDIVRDKLIPQENV